MLQILTIQSPPVTTPDHKHAINVIQTEEKKKNYEDIITVEWPKKDIKSLSSLGQKNISFTLWKKKK